MDTIENDISNVFNFGHLPQLVSMQNGLSHPKLFSYFNDRNLVPGIKLPTQEWAKGYNLESRQLIDSAFMRSLMGDSAEQDFIFENGFYPRLRHMDERPGRLAASPILLYPGENADSVKNPFYVDTNYGVRWVSLSEGLVDIVGDSGYVRMPIAKDSVVRIEAWKEDFSKHVYLTIRARSFVNSDIGYDTVCPGDSVWMKNSYARNDGWNYDVVWGEGNDTSPDTVYRLYLYHNLVYHDTYTDSCHIEELPYMVDGRLMYDFGKTTERYQTAMGCDSTVTYNLVRRWRYYRVRVETRGSGTASVRDTTLREDGSLWVAFTASACHRLDSLRVNGADVPARERYLVEDLRGDCFVEAVFSPSGPVESALTLDVCADSLPVLYNGREYGAGVHEVWLHTAAGCDSVVHLRVVGRENTARLSVRDTIEPPCGERVMSLTYAVESGGPRSLRVSFDAAARAAGFRDTALAIGGGGGRVLLPLPMAVEPGRYGLVLYQADGSGCHAQAGSLGFEVRYPSDIIVQKWDDVLAVLGPEYNGGYAFSGYQWYRNGEAVEGATSAHYTPGRYLRYGDGYAVLLERASDGLRLLSCVYKARRAPGAAVLHLAPNPSRTGEGVRATVKDRPESSGHMEVYDGMGRRIYRAAFEKGTHLLRIDTPGTYLVRAVSADGRWTASEKMVIL